MGRSFLVDGKAKVVLKNGERLVGFGGIRSVHLAIGYNPSISPIGSCYALLLRLKSGDDVPIIGIGWRRWTDWVSSSRTDDVEDSLRQDREEEEGARALEELAREVAALIGVTVTGLKA